MTGALQIVADAKVSISRPFRFSPEWRAWEGFTLPEMHRLQPNGAIPHALEPALACLLLSRRALEATPSVLLVAGSESGECLPRL